MAVCMTVMTSELYNHGRSDPEYFLPKHTKVEADLKAVSTLPLRKLGLLSCSAFYPAATHLYTTKGVPFLRCVDIVNFPVISPDQPFVRIPKSFADAHSTLRSLRSGDVIISKVGTPCYAAVLSAEMVESVMTRTVLGISQIDQSIIDPYYLVAFLRSRHGFDQLMRERELTIQYQLTLDRTRKVKVFIPAKAVQKMVGDLVRKYYQSSRSNVDNYTQAQQLLEAELGLGKLDLDKSVDYTAKFSTVSLSDTYNAGRIDAQCFSTEAILYKNWLLKYTQCERLRNLLCATGKGHQQTETIKGTTNYCSIKHISGRELIDVSKCSPVKEPRIAKQNDLLLAITGATIGKIGIVRRYSSLAFSGDLLRLRATAEISPYYLLVVLNHQIGQIQFNRWITGSTNGHLAPRDVERILIPRLSEDVENQIASLMKESLSKRFESEALLEQAKNRVEQFIEEAVQA